MTTTATSDERRGRRSERLALLLLLLAGGVGALGFVATRTAACGDGLCMAGEDGVCPADCPLTVAGVPAALMVPPGDLSGVTTVPDVQPAPDPPPPDVPAVAPPIAPDPPAPAPAPVADGRCADPAFRAVATAVVNDCEQACKKDDNPVVSLAPEAFEQLFAKPDDGDVATHFALFGCNRYTAGGRECRGFDSDAAAPDQCPPGSPECARYAAPLASELQAFLDAHADAHTILLFGTASRAGNAAGGMSDDNAALAERRATNVQAVVNRWRRQHGKRDTRVFAVVLDNERTDYWESDAFRGVIRGQLAKAADVERGFTPDSRNAMNRSVMVVAISCDLQ